jgi:hypothetical protein
VPESSKSSVTQHDRFANPEKDASVQHIAPFSALRESIRDRRYHGLSAGGRALFTWVCMNSRWLGCAWRRLDVLAKELGIHRRILCMKRRELEDKGLVRTVYVHRGQVLPTGRIARHETAIFWPTTKATVNTGSQSNSSSGSTTINDPSMMIIDRHDHGSAGCTPFCDQIIEEEGGPPTGPPNDPPPSAPENPLASIATDLLQRWKEILAPRFDLYADPETFLEAHAMVTARLRDGVTKTRCHAALLAFAESPHNQTWERRTIQQVFGNLERLERMATLGMSLLGMVPEPKSETRAKTLTPAATAPVVHELRSHEGLLRLVARRKFEVQEVWRSATAKARSGVGLGVHAGYPAQDLELAAQQAPLEIDTWDGFERWFEAVIVEWHATGQHNPKFDATTSALYKWLANGKKHPYVRPQDIKQGGSYDEPWLQDL